MSFPGLAIQNIDEIDLDLGLDEEIIKPKE